MINQNTIFYDLIFWLKQAKQLSSFNKVDASSTSVPSGSSLCILPKFVMHVTNKQFMDKFNNGWKKIQNGCFSAFYVNN